MKKTGILLTVIIMAMLFAVSASAAKKGYYTYEVKKGKATITDVDTSISGDVTIPSTLGGYSVTSIGNSAFEDCTGLTSIIIPDSVTDIGYYAFNGCDSLTSINVNENNKYYSSDSDGVLFNKDKTELIRCPEGKTETTYIIPKSVKSIGYEAFHYCKSLASITIPDSVTSISQWAFGHCSGLTDITIPDSVTDIGPYAFGECTGLISITIPKSATLIDDSAFYCCSKLTSITVDKDNKYYSNDSNGVLFNKDKTVLVAYPAGNTRSTYIIPDSVTSIRYVAFEYCSHLTSIIIPDSVTSIGCSAFRYSGYYNNASNWENGVLYIGNHLIEAEDSVASCNIKQGTKTISDLAFYGCTGLTSITIPDSVTTIGAQAFYGCTGLTSITIPGSVSSIPSGAFSGCESLTSITIGEGVTAIDYYAFSGCKSLKSITVDTNNKYYSSDSNGVLFDKDKTVLIQYPVGNIKTSYTIPESVTSIRFSAFRDCKCLTSITIPDSVTSIGSYAFENCKNLTYVNYTGTQEQWNKISIDYGNDYLTKAPNCSCNCHKSGIAGFFWKIANFFNKLFKVKSKQMCACGVAHY